jgi:hypothetical protein
MTQNFIECDREQAYLMPPSLRDWVAEDHLVWTVLQAQSGDYSTQPRTCSSSIATS